MRICKSIYISIFCCLPLTKVVAIELPVFTKKIVIPDNCKKLGSGNSYGCFDENRNMLFITFRTPKSAQEEAIGLEKKKNNGFPTSENGRLDVKFEKIAGKMHYLTIATTTSNAVGYRYCICDDKQCIEIQSNELKLIHETLKPLTSRFVIGNS